MIDGKTIQVDYKIEVTDKGMIKAERLSVGGKEVDVADGRLFLIDLTALTPTYEQKNAELGEIKSLESSKDVERVASRTLNAIKSKIPKEYWK